MINSPPPPKKKEKNWKGRIKGKGGLSGKGKIKGGGGGNPCRGEAQKYGYTD